MNREEAIEYLTSTLPLFADEHTPEDAEHGYQHQWHTICDDLDRIVTRQYVVDAMEALNSIGLIKGGTDLEYLYGCDNTDENRESWLDQEQQNLNIAINNMTFGIPR